MHLFTLWVLCIMKVCVKYLRLSLYMYTRTSVQVYVYSVQNIFKIFKFLQIQTVYTKFLLFIVVVVMLQMIAIIIFTMLQHWLSILKLVWSRTPVTGGKLLRNLHKFRQRYSHQVRGVLIINHMDVIWITLLIYIDYVLMYR